MKVLDCTLRDGGYYNNWDFCKNVVHEYLDGMAKAKIDIVELGLRNFPKSEFLGAFAYTTEDFLNNLDLPVGPVYGVMVDAKTILQSDLSIEDAIDALFCPASQSKVDLVRVAAHFKEVEKSGPIIKHLKSLGYIVGYNLMQAGGKPDEVISQKAKMAKDWGELDVLYFADSLGNMDGAEVERIVSALRQHWDGELGIHTHNNMSKGLDNTLTAKKSGVSWLDATVTGMGRGAGNTQTENLLAVVAGDNSQYVPEPVFELVIRFFEPMQKKFGWGSNLLYFLGAQNDVHPTFIQNLLSSSHYGTDEIVGAINYLSKLDGTTTYSGDILSTALSFSSSNSKVSGSKELNAIFANREVLLVANGPSCEKYARDIEFYIKKNKPVVLSLNINNCLSEDLIDFYVISHNSKFLSEFDEYKALKKPIILPKHRFSGEELEKLSGIEILDFGIEVAKDTFEVKEEYAVIPYDITAAYALAVISVAKAAQLKLIGFDGYNIGDVRQKEMVEILSFYANSMERLVPLSLTPTSYNVDKGSVYAPIF
jgi:4-hydroxy 2-oxovalerate aldolase